MPKKICLILLYVQAKIEGAMKKKDETLCYLVGKGDNATKDLCRSLAKEGVSVMIKQKETVAAVTKEVESDQHWSGHPGEDLFFNGWKLLF
jgi:hypothetical protein